jgi:hypothetical protein
VTQTGSTLRLRQPRIQGPPLSAGGAPAACAAAQAALPQARPVRSSPPRSPSVRPPPHAARRGDLEGKCLLIGLRPRPSGLCADRAGMPLPHTGGPALGSALNHADHGPPFDAASGQQTGQHSGINECCTLRNNESRAADRKPHGPCGLRGLVRLTVVFAHRIAAAFAARATLRRGAGKQRAANAGTWITESSAHACHRSSHRVESLAVLLRQRAKSSPLGADEHIAAIATHTARQRTFKF